MSSEQDNIQPLAAVRPSAVLLLGMAAYTAWVFVVVLAIVPIGVVVARLVPTNTGELAAICVVLGLLWALVAAGPVRTWALAPGRVVLSMAVLDQLRWARRSPLEPIHELPAEISGTALDEIQRVRAQTASLGMSRAGMFARRSHEFQVGAPPVRRAVLEVFVQPRTGLCVTVETSFNEGTPLAHPLVRVWTLDLLSDGTVCGVVSPPLDAAFPMPPEHALLHGLAAGTPVTDLLALHAAMLARLGLRSRTAGTVAVDWPKRLVELEDAHILPLHRRGWLQDAETPDVWRIPRSRLLNLAVRGLPPVAARLERHVLHRARKAQIEYSLIA